MALTKTLSKTNTLSTDPTTGTLLAQSAGRLIGPVGAARLIPPGMKLKIANMSPVKPAHTVTARAGGNSAAGTALTWAEWDWTGWFKPQIDLAAANGFNCVRLMGVMGGLVRGQLTLAQYVTRWKQVLDYCQTVGLWVYPTGYAFDDFGGASKAYAISVYQALAGLFNGYSNVFAVDLVNEAIGSGSANGLNTGTAVAAYCKDLADAWHAASPIPCTFSGPTLSATSSALFADSATRALFVGFVDFWDYHVYYDAVPADMNAFFTDTANLKPLLIGECGVTVTAGTAAATSRMAALRQMAERPGVLGAGVWVITDQDTDDSNQWGLWQIAGLNQLPKWESNFNGSTLTSSKWVNDGGSAVTLSITQTAPIEGTDALLITTTGAAAGAGGYRAVCAGKGCVPGSTVTVSADLKQVAGTAVPTFLEVAFYTAAGAAISQSAGANVTPPSSGSVTATASGVAPGNAAQVAVKVRFGSGTSAIGDAVMVDNASIISNTSVPRATYLAGAQTLPSGGRPLRIVLAPSADQTLNGGNGTWVDSTGASQVLACAVPVRVTARLVLCGAVSTAGNTVAGRLTVDGAAVDGRDATLAGPTGLQANVTEYWTTFLAPGSHTLKLQVTNFGTATNNVVYYAHSQMILDIEPA